MRIFTIKVRKHLSVHFPFLVYTGSAAGSFRFSYWLVKVTNARGTKVFKYKGYWLHLADCIWNHLGEDRSDD